MAPRCPSPPPRVVPSLGASRGQPGVARGGARGLSVRAGQQGPRAAEADEISAPHPLAPRPELSEPETGPAGGG
jgi:hypothetical protein